MSKNEPIIQKYMACDPKSIDADKTIKEAIEFMKELKIRHLPVMQSGKPYGIVTERDINAAMGIVSMDPGAATVGDICHKNPYCVEPDAKLHVVLDEMAAHHYGSVLITQNSRLVGIFTTTDVCHAFSEVLQQRFHE